MGDGIAGTARSGTLGRERMRRGAVTHHDGLEVWVSLALTLGGAVENESMPPLRFWKRCLGPRRWRISFTARGGPSGGGPRGRGGARDSRDHAFLASSRRRSLARRRPPFPLGPEGPRRFGPSARTPEDQHRLPRVHDERPARAQRRARGRRRADPGRDRGSHIPRHIFGRPGVRTYDLGQTRGGGTSTATERRAPRGIARGSRRVPREGGGMGGVHPGERGSTREGGGRGRRNSSGRKRQLRRERRSTTRPRIGCD